MVSSDMIMYVVVDKTDQQKREKQLVKVAETEQTIGYFLSNRCQEKVGSILVFRETKIDGIES